MKIGILITARLGSQRLKRKHLLEINNKPILGYLVDRISYSFKKEVVNNNIDIIIATSKEIENRSFENYFINLLKIYYGSQTNIPLRHLQVSNKYGLDAIISVDGDDIFCSTNGMKKVLQELRNGSDYVKTINLPLGMNSQGYSSAFLDISLSNYMTEKLETGWGRIFDERELTIIDMQMNKDKRLRFTLDYIDDFKLFKKVILSLGQNILSATDQDIINLVKQKKIYKMNHHLIDKYSKNFKKLLEQEVTELK